MKFRGGEFSTGTTGNFQSELTGSFAAEYYGRFFDDPTWPD
jgi:hypothetical protein